MLARKEIAENAAETAKLIRRQIRHAENRRHLRRLPEFAIDRALPRQFVELLGELRHAETRRRIG